MADTAHHISSPITGRQELRRDVSVWGSYMWGFSDVGANTFVALGLVIAATQGAAPLAFALAGLVYILVGLTYTELASAYPVAGGGQYFAGRGLGDFWGFVGGSALILDYTIDIALFSLFSAGYANFFFPLVFGHPVHYYVVQLGPFAVQWAWLLETLVIIAFLIWLNTKGIRESSKVNEVIGALIILSESVIIICGFIFAWKPEILALQWKTQFPTLNNFMYGSSLAIISFVGLESISQAAQETRRPATIVPRTSITLIFTVFVFATAFSTLGMGLFLNPDQPEASWRVFAKNADHPMPVLAGAIPIIGAIAGPFIAVLGMLILLISANSGVMSVSRVAYSMSQFGAMPTWFKAVHPKYQTPVRTIVIFSGVGIIQTVLAFLTPDAADTLANMYAFGASLGYLLVFLALLRLRFKDPYTPRPYRVPFNVTVKRRGRKYQFPILGIIGLFGIVLIFIEVVWTHEIGRIAGPAWVAVCLLLYFWYRKKEGYPLVGSLKHNWEKEQIEVLTSAEEFDLLEQYKNALKEREKELLHVPAD